MKQHNKLLLGFILGVALGLIGYYYFPAKEMAFMGRVTEVFTFVGAMFLRMIFTVVIPLIMAALMLGTITAVGGGFVRDVVLRRIPGILGGNTLYAVPAILASGVAVVFHHFGMTVIGSVAAIVVGASTILLARWKGLVLPVAHEDVTLNAALRKAMRRSKDSWRPRFRGDV